MMNELENKVFGDLRHHQKMFNKWRKEFNEIRPHEALGMKTPKEVYCKSEKKYLGDDIEIEYNGRMKSRVVNDRGVFHYRNSHIFVGNPFSGYNIGIKERINKNPEVWFDNILLGEINYITSQVEVNMVKSIKKTL
jgi:hypothetical protein